MSIVTACLILLTQANGSIAIDDPACGSAEPQSEITEMENSSISRAKTTTSQASTVRVETLVDVDSSLQSTPSQTPASSSQTSPFQTLSNHNQNIFGSNLTAENGEQILCQNIGNSCDRPAKCPSCVLRLASCLMCKCLASAV